MLGSGRAASRERERVAAQVRRLVDVEPVDESPPAEIAEPGSWVPEPGSWVPGPDLDEPPRLVAAQHRRPSLVEELRLRWDPGRRGLTAVAALVVVVLIATVLWYLHSRPHEVPVTTSGAGSSDASWPGSTGSGGSGGTASGEMVGAVSGTASAGVSGAPVPAGQLPAGQAPAGAAVDGTSPGVTATDGARLVVDVAGKVRRPGIYRLPPGSRIYDALEAAGGARPGVNTLSLNLAQPLTDGEQIVVGVKGAGVAGGGAGPAPSGTGGAAATGPVDLNTATLEQLETLPGVGPVLGQNILDYRNAHGSFHSVDELQDVTGIGDTRLAQLRPLVSV